MQKLLITFQTQSVEWQHHIKCSMLTNRLCNHKSFCHLPYSLMIGLSILHFNMIVYAFYCFIYILVILLGGFGWHKHDNVFLLKYWIMVKWLEVRDFIRNWFITSWGRCLDVSACVCTIFFLSSHLLVSYQASSHPSFLPLSKTIPNI